MPPRTALTSSFSVSDQNNEVVCPLKNQDGTNCRKRCLGEKRYRSMQEHIRRAHPEHYISKLPATEESFQLMIDTPPSARPPPQPPQNTSFGNNVYGHDRDTPKAEFSSPAPPRSLEDAYPAAATAAVALAQLHNHRADSEWGSEVDHAPDHESLRPGTNSSFDLPPLQNHFQQETLNPFHSPRPRELLPSIMSQSPPGRSTTLPPINRPRPRKSSITQNSRKPKHERTKSKDHARRMSIEGRKALSAEPQTAASFMNKRWEDLIEAATSANEADSDRDLTPIPQSPSIKRASLPPFPSTLSHFEAYKASPLAHALTPPPPSDGPEPFPSVESSSHDSSTSGQNFHISSSGLVNSDSSPTFTNASRSYTHTANNNSNSSNAFSPATVQISCAHCRRASVLMDSYACCECIGGFCADCVYLLSSEANRGRPCPKCKAPGPRYKQIQLDLR